MKRFSLLLPLALLLTAVLAAPAQAEVTLSYVRGPPMRLLGAQTPDREYDADTIAWLRCRGRAVPLMAGWTGGRAPVSMVYSHVLESSKQMAIGLRKPFKTTTVRGRLLCATGVRVTTKTSQAVQRAVTVPQRVSCARGQLAIGVPLDGGLFARGPVASKPDGLRGWVNSELGFARAKVVCVPARSFGSAALMRKAATFKPGKATATVTARCSGGRKPISWGYEAGTLDGNVWRSVESAGTMTVPFIAAAYPNGAAGWSLTFATPDGKPATSSTSLALHLTCATPR